MPIYEYRCADCHKKTTIITLSVKETVGPVCGPDGGEGEDL
jgi:putative FmdB family regulatory protein